MPSLFTSLAGVIVAVSPFFIERAREAAPCLEPSEEAALIGRLHTAERAVLRCAEQDHSCPDVKCPECTPCPVCEELVVNAAATETPPCLEVVPAVSGLGQFVQGVFVGGLGQVFGVCVVTCATKC